MQKEVVSFIVPALNEERNIKDTINTIERSIPFEKLDYEIIIIDGGSTDRTVEIADSLALGNGKVRVDAKSDIKGLGHAYKKGISLALGDYIILVPGDNEVSGEAIKSILEMAGEADMIIPYFTNQEIRSVSRRIISSAYVKLLNLISGLKLKYYNGTVLHRSEVIKRYDIKTTGFAYQAEILINLIRSGFSYEEIACKIQERSSGKTKIFNFKNIITVLISLIDIFWQTRIRPLFGKSSSTITPVSLKQDFQIIKELPRLDIPPEISYIAVFLTFACNLQCSYCVNNYEGRIFKKGIMDGEKWVKALNRLKLPHNLPVSLQGGEPTLYRDFYYIIENLRPDIEIDILTNLQFNIDEFIRRVDPKRINRDEKYQSIRASFHPEGMKVEETIAKVKKIQDAGFNISLASVKYPGNGSLIKEMEEKSKEAGVKFFTKDYLGYYEGKLYGDYKYPEAINCQMKKNVQCRTKEILLGPVGEVYKCTRDVYIDNEPIGHILDPDFKVEYVYRFCRNFGYCNPCDIKVKTDRFLKGGHTSVDIKFLDN